jgi:hypothetical protein
VEFFLENYKVPEQEKPKPSFKDELQELFREKLGKAQQVISSTIQSAAEKVKNHSAGPTGPITQAVFLNGLKNDPNVNLPAASKKEWDQIETEFNLRGGEAMGPKEKDILREHTATSVDNIEGNLVKMIVDHMSEFVPPTKIEPSYIESNGAIIENPRKKPRAPKVEEEMGMR